MCWCPTMAAEHEHYPFNRVPNTLSIVCSALVQVTGWELTVGKQHGCEDWVYVLRDPTGEATILRRVDAAPCAS